MYELEIKNPFDETVRNSEEEKFLDFKIIQFKFKKTFYGEWGNGTDRTKMNIEQLDFEYEDWMKSYLTMENGIIEFIIPKTGKYEIIQQSKSTNINSSRLVIGPALGVTVKFNMNLKKVIPKYSV